MNRVGSKVERFLAGLFGLLAFAGWIFGGAGFGMVWHFLGHWEAIFCAWFGVSVGVWLHMCFGDVR